jgi:hypothetical protein
MISGGSSGTRVGGSINGVEQSSHLEIRHRTHVAQRARKLRLAIDNAGEAADKRHANITERIEIERRAIGCAGELQRRHLARPRNIVDLVIALIEHAGHVHPPLEVPTAIAARSADVLAHRKSHRPARALDFAGDLSAARRCARDQHAAIGKLIGIAVLLRGETGN